MEAESPRQQKTGKAQTPFDNGELYDAIFGDLDYDRTFYVELAREARGPVLEVACGTGRILIPCLEAGVEVDGIDLFPSMLEMLKRKAKARGLNPRVQAGDMRDFTLPHRYDLIFIAFNGFVHALTSEDQLKTLRVCREHLLTGGMLVFNIFFPGLEYLSGKEGVPVLETESVHPRTGWKLRVFDTRTFDRVEQVQHSRIEIHELDPEDRAAVIHVSETDMRWTFKHEMQLLLQLAGFQRWELCGGFDRRSLARESDLFIVFAWRD